VLIAKCALGPDVEAAFVGESPRQAGNGDRGRQKEQDRGGDPQDERSRAGVCGRGNPAEADDRADVEEDEIAQPELAAQDCRAIGGRIHRA
jgi:hypothetical protein